MHVGWGVCGFVFCIYRDRLGFWLIQVFLLDRDWFAVGWLSYFWGVGWLFFFFLLGFLHCIAWLLTLAKVPILEERMWWLLVMSASPNGVFFISILLVAVFAFFRVLCRLGGHQQLKSHTVTQKQSRWFRFTGRRVFVSLVWPLPAGYLQ